MYYYTFTIARTQGPRPKTMTRKWKEAEVNSYYPFQSFPDIYLPPDISRDPKASCWRIMDRVGLRPALYISYQTNVVFWSETNFLLAFHTTTWQKVFSILETQQVCSAQ